MTAYKKRTWVYKPHTIEYGQEVRGGYKRCYKCDKYLTTRFIENKYKAVCANCYSLHEEEPRTLTTTYNKDDPFWAAQRKRTRKRKRG